MRPAPLGVHAFRYLAVDRSAVDQPALQLVSARLPQRLRCWSVSVAGAFFILGAVLSKRQGSVFDDCAPRLRVDRFTYGGIFGVDALDHPRPRI